MFIICPKCSAKYQIPEDIKLEEGQKLKCSACDSIFFKGEEAPLPLGPIADVKNEEVPEAFSTPLYTQAELNISPNEALPEAFQPVSTPKKEQKGLGVIFIYIVFVIALCILGWTFRDYLKPSLQENFSVLTQTESRKEVKKEKPVLPKNDKTEAQKKIKAKTTKPISTEKKAVKTTLPATSKKITEQRVSLPAKIDDKKTPIPQVKTEQIQIPEEAIVAIPHQETNSAFSNDIPLFDIMEAPIPLAQEQELFVEHQTFRIEVDENGQEQVLIEGTLKNRTLTPKTIPILTVRVFDKNNTLLTQKKIHTTIKQLNGEQTIPFHTSLTPIPQGINHIDVQF